MASADDGAICTSECERPCAYKTLGMSHNSTDEQVALMWMEVAARWPTVEKCNLGDPWRFLVKAMAVRSILKKTDSTTWVKVPEETWRRCRRTRVVARAVHRQLLERPQQACRQRTSDVGKSNMRSG